MHDEPSTLRKKCGQKKTNNGCGQMHTIHLLFTDRALRRKRLVRNWVCDEFKPARASHLQQGQRQVHGTHRGHICKQKHQNNFNEHMNHKETCPEPCRQWLGKTGPWCLRELTILSVWIHTHKTREITDANSVIYKCDEAERSNDSRKSCSDYRHKLHDREILI